MPGTCAFCGATAKLTGEHVFGDWLSKIGLDPDPVPHLGSPLNRVGRELGTKPPFRTTVKKVCGSCNGGWMSDLEGVARRVMTPFILGEPGVIQPEDLGAVAAWVQKTALVAMLVSSEEERARGYGLPSAEYQHLYAIWDLRTPLLASRFWIGRYQPGNRGASTWVTPIVVNVDGIDRSENAEAPDGYLMTVVVGQLLLHGVRFTIPLPEVSVTTSLGLPVLWPSTDAVEWPSGSALTDPGFFRFVDGRDLQVAERDVAISRWIPATDLPRSRLVGSAVELPLTCGKHVTYYPIPLMVIAQQGQACAFTASCDCGKTYLIHTEIDGARCKAIGEADAIQARYEALPGGESHVQLSGRAFTYKMQA
jgi:hypothetical protein